MAQRITTVTAHRQFKKHYKQRVAPHPSLLKRFEKRYVLFITNRDNPSLKDHRLTGGLRGYRAFSITGDIRVIYQLISETTVQLMDIGAHNQVY